MAKIRAIEDPPATSSSESEAENNSDQETDSESDVPKPQNVSDQDQDNTDESSDAHIPEPTLNIPQPKSDSASDSNTDSDSDLPSNFTIKPIQSKQPEAPVKSSQSGSKRVAGSEPEEGLKELKKSKVEDEGIKKGSAIQRIFSEDDEIALLEGIIEFQTKKGLDAYSDIGKFHEFIKKSIHFDASTNQLKEKIRRLKNKYLALIKKSGENPVFSKNHDLKVYNLSKKLWWSNNVSVEGGKGEERNSKKQKKKLDNGEFSNKERKKKNEETHRGVEEEDRMVAEDDFWVKYPLCVGGLVEAGLSHNDYWFQNLALIGKAKLMEYEAALENMKWEELEFFIKKKKVVNEMLSLLVDASKSN